MAGPTLAQQPDALLSAREVIQDRDAGTITAQGDVEVAYGTRTLRADRIIYHTDRDVILAEGNVAIIDDNGDAVFAERAEVTSDLDEAFVNQVRALLRGSNRMTAANAVRTGDNLTVFNKARFTPCSACTFGDEEQPLWHLEADEVTHDQEARTLRYRNARLNMFGIPVAYTPYFQHPDWTVTRQSGLLSPSFGSTSFQGAYINLPYYHVIDDTSDITLTPRIMQNRLPVLSLEHRQLLPYGEMRTEVSGTYSRRRDLNDRWREESFRGHIDASGRFSLTDRWRAGYDLRRSTDQSYLRAYDFVDASRYNSHAFAERFDGRSYFGANAFAYQILTDELSEKRQPIVLPLLEFSHAGEPQWGSAYPTLDASLLSIVRREGREVGRLSVTPGITLPAIGRFGEVYKFRAAVQMDGYWTQGHQPGSSDPDPANPDDQITTGRIFPHASLEVRYPWLIQSEGLQQTLEPTVQFVAAPSGGNHRRIPNEDSVDITFDDTNLFSISRYPGLDRVDSGSRVDYGLNYSLATGEGFYSELFLGQSYRFEKNNAFPADSGLRNRRSDFVTRLRLRPIDEIDLVYRARLDHSSLRPLQQEAEARLGPDHLNVELGYMDIPDLSNQSFFGRREEVSGQINAQLSRRWYASAYATRDLAEDYTPRVGLALGFECECFNFSAGVERRRYRDREIEPGYNFLFNITFRYLGGAGSD
ncbi:LPS-assembly protein LptD [Aquibaculum arenosum]|uniref:LPS-assembly protein LptD n=1 Tax=Aquibaculum arenosum TaxID=3032591 RepID=A0ABT5YMP7_9PROT|nr:LPS assembly protein LptD [Fodinicurvata sp. CAU 1616]MDF2096200.1 LPS assembly protein LptD [Fodinicurvata sp. CAU 1616]